jgi:hypothetical protein
MPCEDRGYRRWACGAGVGPLLYGTAWFGVGPDIARLEVVGLLSMASGFRRIERHSGRVVVVHHKLRPLWIATVVHLDARNRVSLGRWSARAVVETLISAGFEVEERSAWLLTPNDIDLHGMHADTFRRQ